MTAKETLGFTINDKELIETVRHVCTREGLSYRALGEAVLAEALIVPGFFDTAIIKAHQLMRSTTGEINRLHVENLALRQRIAELEKLHPNSVQIQTPIGGWKIS